VSCVFAATREKITKNEVTPYIKDTMLSKVPMILTTAS